jgi:hypothetical protein
MRTGDTIRSVGLPPERHADRVVAEMMRRLAERRSHLWPAIEAVLRTSADGSPRSQRKLEQRVMRAGAMGTKLESGKRGRYTLDFVVLIGWDQTKDRTGVRQTA